MKIEKNYSSRISGTLNVIKVTHTMDARKIFSLHIFSIDSRQSIRRSYYRFDWQFFSRLSCAVPIFRLHLSVVKNRGESNSSEDFTGRDYLRGKIRDCPRRRQARTILGNVLAWRHVSVYAMVRRGGKREWP